MLIQLTPTQRDRFWSYVDNSAGLFTCWPWTGARIRAGYGTFRWQNRSWYAHRLVWLMTHGPIPDSHCVLHACDNPPCCNPAHLWLGTHAENMADMDAKGRRRTVNVRGDAWYQAHPPLPPSAYARGDKHGSRTHPARVPHGEAHPHAKVSADDVREIRKRRAAGESLRDLAAAFGVNEGNISEIARRQAWRHID